MAPTTLLVVSPFPILRRGIRSVLAEETAFLVIDEAKDGSEAEATARRLQPDLVLIDVGVADRGVCEMTAAILASAPSTRIVMLAASSEMDLVAAAGEVGVAGCVPKDAPLDELLKTLRTVIDPEGATQSLGVVARPADVPLLARPSLGAGEQAREKISSLTPRQQEILRLLCQGASNREIATSLTIAEDTVANHLKAIYGRLGVHRRAEAVWASLQDESVLGLGTG